MDRLLFRLSESLAHLFVDFMQLAFDVASGVVGLFFV